MISIKNEKDSRIIFIAETYSRGAQTVKALEELAELQKALCKLHTCRDYKAEILNKEIPLRKDVEEEIADVIIMLNQMIIDWIMDEKEIARLINYKLDRQIRRIENGE